MTPNSSTFIFTSTCSQDELCIIIRASWHSTKNVTISPSVIYSILASPCNWTGTPNTKRCWLTFLYIIHIKGKRYHIIIFEECCWNAAVLQERTWPASKDCYLYNDLMTRLLTSISLRSTLDTMAALDFLNSLAKNKNKKKPHKNPFMGSSVSITPKRETFLFTWCCLLSRKCV